MAFDAEFGKQRYMFVCVWLQWRSVAKTKQEDDDFSFARELRDREKRLQALEQQLEQRARSDCFYSSYWRCKCSIDD